MDNANNSLSVCDWLNIFCMFYYLTLPRRLLAQLLYPFTVHRESWVSETFDQTQNHRVFLMTDKFSFLFPNF